KFLAASHVEFSRPKVLIVGNKDDTEGAAERGEILQEAYKDQFSMVKLSAISPSPGAVEAFKGVVYDFLDVVRVYTKVPGKKPDFTDPYVVAKGSTVLDVAEKVHRDFVQNLKYSRIWGEGKVDGIMVPRDLVIGEGDVLELHT